MFLRRTLLLTEIFPPEIGGIQHYLAGLWDALPASSSAVVASVRPHTSSWDAERRYQLLRMPMRGWTYPRWRPALRALTKMVHTWKPEVIVCGKALFEGRAVLAMNAHLPTPLPYVVMTYAMEIEEWLSRARTRRQLLHVLQHAARIVVINEKTKQRLIDGGIRPEQLVKIYPGVHEDFFSPVDGVDAYRNEQGLTGKRVLTTVSRLVPRKGVDIVLRALPDVLQRIPQLVYCIAGVGPERERLMRTARALGIGEHVRFLGSVGLGEMRKLLTLSEICILTPLTNGNDWEGFGMVYLEASAMGRPSIGSRSGGVPEAVIDGETGLLVEEDSVAETAHAIIRLFADDALRERLGLSAHARAEREFHWRQRAFLFRGMIEAVAHEASAGTPALSSLAKHF